MSSLKQDTHPGGPGAASVHTTVNVTVLNHGLGALEGAIPGQAFSLVSKMQVPDTGMPGSSTQLLLLCPSFLPRQMLGSSRDGSHGWIALLPCRRPGLDRGLGSWLQRGPAPTSVGIWESKPWMGAHCLSLKKDQIK